MPAQAHRPSALAWQVFRGSEAVRQGLLTTHQLRNSAWARLRRDIYVDARLDRDHELACRAVALQLPVAAAFAGPSAAYLHGVEHAASFADKVHVLVPAPAGLRSQPGLQVHTMSEEPWLPGIGTGTLRRTDPARAAWESAVWLEPTRAIAIIDTLLGRGLTTRAALAQFAALHDGRPGIRRASWLFDLAEPAAQSPAESQLRIRLVLAGLPRPVVQHPVQVSGGLILHPDLAWPAVRVAVEYDGHWHSDREQLHRDRQRLNRLVGAGWLVLHVTSRRLHQDFPGIVREVRAALLDRGWHR
ncbi:endonuclease domain-containing protein [Verrucosispora sp. WMMD703]|uniref:endonuclease domain-containing protein n=1 Tax=Verrucosispora sp. WMMD703 TaxID=3403463 RepID=UPI003B965618